MEKNVRLRVLYIMEYLTEETDSSKGVKMSDIMDYINERGIAGERKSIYEDIRALQEFGLPIAYHSEDRTYRFEQ